MKWASPQCYQMPKWALNNKIILPVGLVNNNVGPDDVLEESSVLTNHLVVRQESIEGQLPAGVLQLELPDDLPGVGAAVVADGVDVRRPGGELLLPGRHGGQRHHHQHRALEGVDVEEILEEGDGLDGFSETLKTKEISKTTLVRPQ